MSKPCPLYGVAIYMDCLECTEKPCKSKHALSNSKQPPDSKSPLRNVLATLEDKAGVNDGS